jgi:3-phosphoshikimate 1-carboxyvinyltransferase
MGGRLVAQSRARHLPDGQQTMNLTVRPSNLAGSVAIPGSKSHTIRAIALAALAHGESRLDAPLQSADTASALRAATALGAEVSAGTDWRIGGVGGRPGVPEDVVDVGNSGTSEYVMAAIAALADGASVFTGDEQIRRRPVEPLLAALRDLGAEAFTTRGNGCAPFVVRGPLRGGKTALECPTSQYLTALLLACPFAAGDTEIEVLSLTEHPYVAMTLHWLDQVGVQYDRARMERFWIPGRQHSAAFECAIPADWSSATFFLCAGALGAGPITLTGLDLQDPQGDKAVVDMLRQMGARIETTPAGLTVSGGDLYGAELDLNATPDALPALAVTACFAAGETRLVNVAQARLKETDRIAVMARELRTMGANVQECEDGLAIQGAPLCGAVVDGHGDHRVVMALAVAGTFAEGETTITTAEAVGITFPNFVELMVSLGARMQVST